MKNPNIGQELLELVGREHNTLGPMILIPNAICHACLYRYIRTAKGYPSDYEGDGMSFTHTGIDTSVTLPVGASLPVLLLMWNVTIVSLVWCAANR